MNINGFDYSVWFERCDDGKNWAFTTSGKDDENSLDCPELTMIFNEVGKFKKFADSIVKIGIIPNGGGGHFSDFHFEDGSVSPPQAYINESNTFLSLIELTCIGYLKTIYRFNEECENWNIEFDNYVSS